MSPMFREILNFVVIGLAFGLIWATMQFAKGEIRDPAALVIPVIVFGLAGIPLWALRKFIKNMRR